MNVRPFKAWYADPARAARIASVPYDVVDTDEARALAAGNPDSFLHVTRPEIDLPGEADPHSPATYAQGVAALQNFHAGGRLRDETSPVFYLYRLRDGAHVQTGLVATWATSDYADGTIKTHEKTRPDKEDDRLQHFTRLQAHDEPVFLVHRDTPAVTALAATTAALPPLADFTASDGVRNTLWRISDTAAWRAAFAAVPAVYIADGHHRAAASARLARESGAAEAAWFLAVAFPASQTRILPYNRLLLDLNGHTPAALLEALRSQGFTVQPTGSPAPGAPHQAGLFLEGRWHALAWKHDPRASPVDALDVSVLQNRILAPLFGIADPRTSPRIAFVGGIHGHQELEKRVRAGRAAAAFALFPTRVEEMMAIADAGSVMPPKSTWFEPKLRSGLFVHPF
ncbi:MAG: DUF1015 family protein [bacterium]